MLRRSRTSSARRTHLQNAKATDKWYNQNKKRAAASAGVEIGDRKTSHLSLQRAAAASVERTDRAYDKYEGLFDELAEQGVLKTPDSRVNGVCLR